MCSLRGQVVEHACNIPSLLMGESVQTIAQDMDCYSMRTPLGVCAGIAPCVLVGVFLSWLVCSHAVTHPMLA